VEGKGTGRPAAGCCSCNSWQHSAAANILLLQSYRYLGGGGVEGKGTGRPAAGCCSCNSWRLALSSGNFSLSRSPFSTTAVRTSSKRKPGRRREKLKTCIPVRYPVPVPFKRDIYREIKLKTNCGRIVFPKMKKPIICFSKKNIKSKVFHSTPRVPSF
jgi:hypothetical protein